MVRTLREAQQMITQRRPNGRQAFGLVWALLVIDVHVQAQPGSIAAAYHPQWIGTGNGQFLLVNAGWMQPGWRFWCQTLPVCPGQTYTISFRAMSLAATNPPTLAWFVNNNWTGDDLIPPSAQATWQTLSTSWTAPVGVTSADFCVQVSSGWGVGNDFGIDDIVISSNVVLTDAAQVTVTPLPAFDLGPNAQLCTGQNLVLDAAVPGATYLWQDGSTDPDYVVSGPGNYNVAVTANGCTASDAITVNYNAVPAVNLGPDQTLCTGQVLNLNVFQPGATYKWQNGSNAPSYTVTGPGTYSVTVWSNGCAGGDAIDVAYNPMPVVNIGPDQTLCAGDQVLLDATTAGATYLWQDGSTGATYNVSSAGSYDVDVTVNGCTANDAVTLNYNPLPVAALGPDQTLCAGQTLNLNVAQPGATYLWQDGSTNASFTVNSAGTYSVDVLLNGCSVSDAINVAYNLLPVAALGPDQTLCAGQTLNLNVAQPGATYLWQDGSTNASFTVSSAGTYSVDVLLIGCSASDAINVAYNPSPVAALGPDQTLCAGQTLNLNVAQPGATYLWQDGSTNASFTVNSAGTYSVDVLLNGCSASDAINVAYTPVLVVDLGPDQTLCDGHQIILDASTPGGGYVWQDGSTNATFTVSTSGTYSVDVTASNCAASDAITVTFNPVPVVDLGPDQTVCPGTNVTLDATLAGATYLWQDGSTGATLTSDQPGNYSVQVTAGGCSASDAVTIAQFNLQTVDLGPDQTICQGTSTSLSLNVAGATYLWNTGAASNAINAGTAGTYWVEATLNGCSVRDSLSLLVTPLPVVDLGLDPSVCPGDLATLNATQAGATYLWSTGDTSPTIDAGPGNYSVTVTVNGCSGTDAVVVDSNPAPQLSLGNDTTLCPGEQLIVDATQAGASYVWQDGSTGSTITVTSAGIYSIDLTDANGCMATDDIAVAYANASSIDLGNDTTLCAGAQLILDATLPGATYLWSTGEQTASITVSS